MVSTFKEIIPTIRASQWTGSLYQLVKECVNGPACFRFWIDYLSKNTVTVNNKGDMCVEYANQSLGEVIPCGSYFVYKRVPGSPKEIGIQVINGEEFESKYELDGGYNING